ncbi:NAD(+) kinase [Methyloparacoccus murrellii]
MRMTALAGFRVAALIGKPDAGRIAETLTELHALLIRRGIRVIVDADSAPFIHGVVPDRGSLRELGQRCDFAVVVGGDGTLLAAARALAEYDIPLIGVNLGRLGFLVDISPADVATHLDAVLQGRFLEEERFMLGARVMRHGQVIFQQTAINDVVIHRSHATSMIEIVTHIDGLFLNSQRSDGLIVSTPTGSTAYALSAGGPILSPTLPAIVLAPINPHALTNRPIVIDSRSTVGISFRPGKLFGAQVVCDNISSPGLDIDDTVEIRREAKPFRLLHPLGYDFFEILRVKLNWSSGYRI